jgi:hypothetical protein
LAWHSFWQDDLLLKMSELEANLISAFHVSFKHVCNMREIVACNKRTEGEESFYISRLIRE